MSLTRFHVQNNALSPPADARTAGICKRTGRFYCAGSFFLKYFQLVGSPSILGKTCSNSCTDLGHAVPKRTLGLRWSACGCHPICPTQRLTGPNEGCFLLSFLRPTGCFRVGPGLSPKAVAGIQPDAIIALLNGKNSSLRYYTNNIFKISPLNGLIQPLTSSQGTGITPQCPQ